MPSAGLVEGLVPDGVNHAVQLLLGQFARHFCNQTYDSRHSIPKELLSRTGTFGCTKQSEVREAWRQRTQEDGPPTCGGGLGAGRSHRRRSEGYSSEVNRFVENRCVP